MKDSPLPRASDHICNSSLRQHQFIIAALIIQGGAWQPEHAGSRAGEDHFPLLRSAISHAVPPKSTEHLWLLWIPSFLCYPLVFSHIGSLFLLKAPLLVYTAISLSPRGISFSFLLVFLISLMSLYCYPTCTGILSASQLRHENAINKLFTSPFRSLINMLNKTTTLLSDAKTCLGKYLTF